MNSTATTFAQSFFHGTKADLKKGDLIEAGYTSNYGARSAAAHVYFAATLDAAVWGAELAVGDGSGRIYVVEPKGAFEDDPDLTNKRFPGNPSMSYRSCNALRVIGEVINWTGHALGQVIAMRSHIALLEQTSADASRD
jgi:hypothetical protein